MLIAFITQYRLMETSQLEHGFSVILNAIFSGSPEANGLATLCRHWKYSQQFGQFFTNHLKKDQMIRLLNHWGIQDPDDQEYLDGCEQSYSYHTTHHAPDTVTHIFRMILFFEGRGMRSDIIPGIILQGLPESKNDRFGSSANWGKYILSLNYHMQESFFDALFSRFNS